MSQKSEKYARDLRRRQEDVEARMDRTEKKVDGWERAFAAAQLEAINDAQRERTYARYRQREAERAVKSWKAVAYGSLAAAIVVLAIAITATAKADEKPAEMPPASASEDKVGTIAAVMESPAEPQETRFERIIENATVTHYCICEKCCGKTPNDPAYGITASGREAVPYYSVAVDPAMIELGTTLYLDFGDGVLQECRADDTGFAVSGAHIDLCVSDHQEALELGIRTAAVYIEEVA